MPKIKYKSFRFSPSSRTIIAQANTILSEYQERGIVVTLRQLYYQFVARDIIQNKQTEYKRLGSIINDARLGGQIDWNLLQDRTRNLNKSSSWSDPSGVIASAAQGYHIDLWKGQPNYVEVWVEKDALLSVIESVCQDWDVPYFACRGYTSQSEMWSASQRMLKQIWAGQKVKIIHLGDHDPSGIDMSRDVEERLFDFISHHMIRDYADAFPQCSEESEKEFLERVSDGVSQSCKDAISIDRVALNMDQIREYNPPPNWAKVTDSRASKYIKEFGTDSWELDALPPDVLTDLIHDSVLSYIDTAKFDERQRVQETQREILVKVSKHWPSVCYFAEKL